MNTPTEKPVRELEKPSRSQETQRAIHARRRGHMPPIRKRLKTLASLERTYSA